MNIKLFPDTLIAEKEKDFQRKKKNSLEVDKTLVNCHKKSIYKIKFTVKPTKYIDFRAR